MTGRAGKDGGGIFVSGNGATLTNMTASTIISNRAQGQGGACSFNGGVSLLANNTFGHNWSGSSGGAIAYEYDCFVAGNSCFVKNGLACLQCCYCKFAGALPGMHVADI